MGSALEKKNRWEILKIFSEISEDILGMAIDLRNTIIAFYVWLFYKEKSICSNIAMIC